MSRFYQVLESRLLPILGRLASQTHLTAIRDGLIAIMPLTIIGSLPLLIANPFVPKPDKVTGFFTAFAMNWHEWVSNPAVRKMILTPYEMTFGLIGLFASMTIAYSLARTYKMNEISAVVVAGVTFLLVASPAESFVLNSAEFNAMKTDFLGGKGLFTALLVGILTVEITRFLRKRRLTIRMPEGAPPAVANAFDNMTPLLINIVIFYTFSLILQGLTGYLLPEWVMKILAPAIAAVDSPFAVFFAAVFANLLWFTGIHGAVIVSSAILGAFFEHNIAANAAAVAQGEAPPYIFTKMFWAFYMVIGGSGATLALVLLYLRSKSTHLRSVGRVALVPAIFNINEPVIFGTPVVFNPTLFFPFVFIEGILGVIAYYATKWGLVGATFAEAPWTAPAPLGAFYAALDFRAALLVFLLIGLSGLLWFPFFKLYERQLLQESGREGKTKGAA